MSTQPPRPGESDGTDASDDAAPEGGEGGGTDHVGGTGGAPPDGDPTEDGDDPTQVRPHPSPTTVPSTAWRADLSVVEADRASRSYWESEAGAYQAEHGAFLAEARPLPSTAGTPPARPTRDPVQRHGSTGEAGAGAGFVWGPEGVTEGELQMLGPLGELAGRRVLEVGCGAAQCSAWLAQHGVHAVGVDISVNQLRYAVGAVGAHPTGGDNDPGATRGSPTTSPAPSGPATPPQSGGQLRQEQRSATRLPDGRGGDGVDTVWRGRDADRPGTLHVVAGTGTALPFLGSSFDAALSAYGAVQFVADLPTLLAEVRRVLVPGGRWVFSVTHPIRWAFPDEPGPEGLSVSGSYFDRTPYVERDASGNAVYAEFHRTLGDYVAALLAAGFSIDRIVEPEWPDWNEATWGGWSPLRGMHLPGTLIIGCRAGGGSA